MIGSTAPITLFSVSLHFPITSPCTEAEAGALDGWSQVVGLHSNFHSISCSCSQLNEPYRWFPLCLRLESTFKFNSNGFNVISTEVSTSLLHLLANLCAIIEETENLQKKRELHTLYQLTDTLLVHFGVITLLKTALEDN